MQNNSNRKPFYVAEIFLILINAILLIPFFAIVFSVRFIKRMISSQRLNRIGNNVWIVIFITIRVIGNTVLSILRFLKLIPIIEHFDKGNIKNILLIRTDRIGDFILSTPAIYAVRENFPNAKISLMVTTYISELIIGDPNVDDIILIDRMCLKTVLKMAKQIRMKNFDLVAVLYPNIWANLLAYLSRAPFRTGYDDKGSGFLLTKWSLHPRERGKLKHEVEYTLDILRFYGIDTKNKKLNVSVTEYGEKKAALFLQHHNIKESDIMINIHPGASKIYRRWNKERFAELADKLLLYKNVKVVFTGDNSERSFINEIVLMMKNKPILAVGNTRITEIVSLIKRCSLYIGNFTGPMHIASVFNVPIIVILGSKHPADSPEIWAPGEGHIVIDKDVDCTYCIQDLCKDLKCMNNVTVDDIMDAVRKQLSKTNKALK
ncbi:MAG: glycosyltransferase family 9 protein [Candidatus Firestonebacteria bacterium]